MHVLKKRHVSLFSESDLAGDAAPISARLVEVESLFTGLSQRQTLITVLLNISCRGGYFVVMSNIFVFYLLSWQQSHWSNTPKVCCWMKCILSLTLEAEDTEQIRFLKFFSRHVCLYWTVDSEEADSECGTEGDMTCNKIYLKGILFYYNLISNVLASAVYWCHNHWLNHQLCGFQLTCLSFLVRGT